MQHVLRQPGQPLQQRHGHLGANDGRDLHQAFGLRGEAVEARRQHRLDGVRQRQGAGVVAVLHRRPGQLLHKEGIARRLGHNRLLQRAGSCAACGTDCTHHQAVAGREPRQRHLGRRGVRRARAADSPGR